MSPSLRLEQRETEPQMADYASLPPRELERVARGIKPGEWAVERERPISTLLGSCVAVCMYDDARQLAGMNHFMLPKMRQGGHADEDVVLAGDSCMEVLLNAMLQRGAAKHRIRAKAFGGGAVIDSGVPGAPAIGKRNADFTHAWLDRENIPLIASDFLGPWARKVVLVPSTGDVYCKRVASALISRETLRREQQAYADSPLNRRNGDGENRIELFR